MRHAARLSSSTHPCRASGAGPEPKRSDWATLRRLLPYLWQYKWRVAAALAFMVGAKLANIGVPLLLKELVDGLSPNGGRNLAQAAPADLLQAVLVVPIALLFGYGLLRLSTTLFTELRELVFAKATEGAARSHLAAGVPPPARAEPAFSPGPPDRRHDARHRARHARRAFADLVFALQHRPDADRGHAGADAAGGEVRHLVRLDHDHRAGVLHHLHGHGDAVAHPVPAPDERARLGRRTAAPSTRC